MPIKIESFCIGCGRYPQKRNILNECVAELQRYGKHPLLLSGKNAWEIAGVPADAIYRYYAKIMASSAMKSATFETERALRAALEYLRRI